MAEVHEFCELACREKQDSEAHASLPEKFCAYNLSGKRFISNEVTVAGAASPNLRECLEVLVPESASAVWIFPLRRLLPVDFSVPADLLYLDEERAVLGIVQSFPIVRVTAQLPEAASILVLPAQSAFLAGIEPGHRLVICSPGEMEEFLLHPQGRLNKVAAGLQLLVPPGPQTNEPQPAFKDTGANVLDWAERLEDAAASGAATPSIAVQDARPEEPARAALGGPITPYVPPKLTLWQKLLGRKSTDPRRAARTVLPGLVAYFFTGGVPAPHSVKNISGSGLYVLTSERWYPGTVVRLTLTDEREPTAERSITVHAKVIRSMEDGVALQFVVRESMERVGQVTVSSIDPLAKGSSREQVEEFIKSFETALSGN